MLTFFTEFFKTLGQQLATNLALIVLIIGVGFIIYMLLTSKNARLIVEAIKNALVKKLMHIPFIAEAVYDKTIANYEKDLEKMHEHKKDLQAELEGFEQELAKNAKKIAKNEKKAKMALAQGDEAAALEYASEVINLKNDNKNLEEQAIPSMKASIEIVEKRMADIRMLIDRTKSRKKVHLRAMKVGKLDEKTSDSLMGYGTSSNEQLLTFFEEKAEYQRNRSIGARKEYESSIEYKDRKLDEMALQQEARQMLDKLRQDALPKK